MKNHGRWSKIRWYKMDHFFPTCPLHFKRFIIFTGMQAGSFRSLAQRLALPSYGLSWPRGVPRSQWPSSLKAWWRSFCWMTFQVWNDGRWSRFSDCLGIYETYIVCVIYESSIYVALDTLYIFVQHQSHSGWFVSWWQSRHFFHCQIWPFKSWPQKSSIS